jgi:hypothetical protein
LHTKEETVTAIADTQSDTFHILKRHFDPSFEMLERLIDGCPDDLWLRIWQQVYHTLFGIEFWFRLEDGEVKPPDWGKDVSPELDYQPGDHLTRNELRDYAAKMRAKAEAFFQAICDRPFGPCAIYDKITNADVVMMQVRHFQYHIGDCNSILGSRGVRAVEWLGYGE